LASGTNQFPHVHGHELAVRAATIREGLRVVMMSANPDKELAAYGIKRSPLPFLQKPFENARLIRLVRDALAGPTPALNLTNQPKAANDVDWFG
jgi:FixJ family two-component response regulator